MQLKKSYSAPEIVRRGDMRELTQGWGFLGLGDILGGSGGDDGNSGSGSG